MTRGQFLDQFKEEIEMDVDWGHLDEFKIAMIESIVALLLEDARKEDDRGCQ